MDPAELVRQLPTQEVFKLQHIGGNLVVDSVRGSRLLIRPVTPRTELDRLEETCGIVVPQGAKEQYTPKENIGIIVRLGDGVPKGMYQEGQAVFYSKWSGTEFTESKASGSFKIISTDDVLCTMRAKEGALNDAVKVEEKEAA